MALEVTHHGESGPPAVTLYYDFASPESYVALELLAKALAAVTPELTPVRERALDALPAPDDAARRTALEQAGAAHGLMPFVWPSVPAPLDTSDAVTVATYAKSIGKVAVFSLSLLRQIYAAGRDPAAIDTLYLAAAASEIHPRAVDQALSRAKPAADADAATERARRAGVTSVPALVVADQIFSGPSLLDDAAQVLARLRS